MIEVLFGSKEPLNEMGIAAGICWNAQISDVKKNRQRAIDCINSGHGRVMEYPDITVNISGYSARCIRELYTHIIGTSRLQESTRYVTYNNFNYYSPFMDPEQTDIYNETMDVIKENYKRLLNTGLPKEDIANILPLGMTSNIVLKINARALQHLANMRLCKRAYKEIRKLTMELKLAIGKYSDEWMTLVNLIMVPKCEKDLFCIEAKCCGAAHTKQDVETAISEHSDKNKVDLIKENNRLKKELEDGKKRWKYFESRFVKCNTCTDDMKEKCIMFQENLCEGERCDELVDLEALIDKAIDNSNVR